MEGSREFLGVALMGAIALAVGLTEATLAIGAQSGEEPGNDKFQEMTRVLASAVGLEEGQVADFFRKGVI
jgi:hypothetical protein